MSDEETVEIQVETLEELTRYLGGRPWREVSQVMPTLIQLHPDQPSPSDLDDSDEDDDS